METVRMGHIYQQIAEKLDEMIPDDWKQIYLYAEVIDNDSTLAYFYFNTNNDDTFAYYHDIPAIYKLDRPNFKNRTLELFELIKDLHEECKSNSLEIWTNLTLKLDCTGKFNIDYDYEDVLASDLTNTERQWLFEHKHFGLLPEDERDRAFVENYLRNRM